MKRFLLCCVIAFLQCPTGHTETTIVYNEAQFRAALSNTLLDGILVASGQTIDISSTLPIPYNVMKISGEYTSQQSLPILDGIKQFRVLHVQNTSINTSGDLESITHLIFRNGLATEQYGSGGAIQIDGNVISGMEDVHFESNKAYNGAALSVGGYFKGGLSKSSFIDNIATGQAAFYVGGRFTGGFDNVVFENNLSNSWSSGGAGFVGYNGFQGGISQSRFSNNHGKGNFGGGFAISKGDFDGGINNSLFENNSLTTVEGLSTTHFGGAVGISGQFSGGIKDSRFIGNKTPEQNGYGGAFAASVLNGGIDHSVFKQNSAWLGGAVSLFNIGGNTGLLNGGIHNSQFVNNTASAQGGAVFAGGSGMSGGIYDSIFDGNYAASAGGAFITTNFTGDIVNSRFIGNGSVLKGGGILVLGQFSGNIQNTVFAQNTVHGSDNSTSSGQGGAFFGRGNLNIENSRFIANSATTDNDGDMSSGYGGAIFHDASTGDGNIAIKATNRNKVIFHANSQNPGGLENAANAIHLANNALSGNDLTTHMVLMADEYSDIFMFDPLTTQIDDLKSSTGTLYGNLKSEINKTGKGNWYLGGQNVMGGSSHWTIYEGNLHLVSVDGAEASIIMQNQNSSGFTLSSNGYLLGSGRIDAEKVVLSGIISPDQTTNTEYISENMDVQTVSSFGKLSFNHDVDLKGAVYDVNAAYYSSNRATGFGTSDLIRVTGKMTVEDSKINIASFGYSGSYPLTDAIIPVSRIIETGDGIFGNFNMTVAGQALHDVDFLQVTGGKDATGKNFDLSMRLSWHDMCLDENGMTMAHGRFTLLKDQSFTINGNLEDRLEITTATNKSGWDGQSLIKTGQGTLILNGTNSYSGATTVEQGTLVIGDSPDKGASIVSNIIVENNAVISGHGTIYGILTLAPDAMVAPGYNDIGILQTQSVVFNRGSVFEVDATDGGEADQLIVNGQALINGGAVHVLAQNGAWSEQTRYIIIDAPNAPIIGSFDDLTTNLAFLSPALDYSNPNQVALVLKRDQDAFKQIGQTYNQRQTGEAISNLSVEHAITKALIGMDHQKALKAYDQLSGEIYASTRAILIQDSQYFRTAINQHLENITFDKTYQDKNCKDDYDARCSPFWVSTWGHKGNISSDGNAARTKYEGYGNIFGFDANLVDRLQLGAAIGYENKKVKLSSGRRSQSDINAYHLGFYSSYQQDKLKINAGLAYSYFNLETLRSIDIPGLSSKAQSNYHAGLFQSFIEANQRFNLMNNSFWFPMPMQHGLSLTQTMSTKEALPPIW